MEQTKEVKDCPITENLIAYVFFPQDLADETKNAITTHIESCLKCAAVVGRYQQELPTEQAQEK